LGVLDSVNNRGERMKNLILNLNWKSFKEEKPEFDKNIYIFEKGSLHTGELLDNGYIYVFDADGERHLLYQEKKQLEEHVFWCEIPEEIEKEFGMNDFLEGE
jgi:hypothetical protein